MSATLLLFNYEIKQLFNGRGCNRPNYIISQDAIFLTHSEMLYFLGIFKKED
jgi:hypothetical protein